MKKQDLSRLSLLEKRTLQKLVGDGGKNAVVPPWVAAR